MARKRSRHRLDVGDRAPHVIFRMEEDGEIEISEFLRRGPLVLFFYPRDETPVCTKEACQFRDHYGSFRELGAEVLGVGGGASDSKRRFRENHRLPYPLVSDGDGTLRRAFDVSHRFGILPRRVTYVIDQQGTVVFRLEGLLSGERHSHEALAALRRLSPRSPA